MTLLDQTQVELNTKLASAMVSHLSRFDGKGYDLMGLFAQEFLFSIASDGNISEASLAEYSEKVNEMTYESAGWRSIEAFAKAEDLSWAVRQYINDRSTKNAIAVIEA